MSFIGERVHISNEARQLQKEGFPNPPVPLTETGTREEILQRWFELKPELYAITAVFTDRIVSRTVADRENRPPFGVIFYDEAASNVAISPTVVTDISDMRNPNRMQHFIQAAITRAAREELRDIYSSESSGSSRVKTIHDRYKVLVDYWNTYINQEDSLDYAQFLGRGALTASNLMAHMIKVVPNIYEQEGSTPPPEILHRTLKNSFPLVADLAMAHLYDAALKLEQVSIGDWFKRLDSSKLRIIDTRQGQRVTFKDGVFTQPDEAFLQAFHERNLSGPDIVGCPAMVNFDGKSPVRKLWEWHLDIADILYKER